MYENVNDSEFIELLKQDEGAAFRWLFDRYSDFIYSVALRFSRNEVQAKDALQEVLIKLWQHRAELNGINNLTAYIQRLTRNHIIDILRRKAQEAKIINRLVSDSEAARNYTEEWMLRKDMEQLLQQAVNRLPSQQRKVYQMSRLDGLKHDDIAARLGITKDAVKKHMMAALKNIQLYIQASNSTIGMLCVCIVNIYL